MVWNNSQGPGLRQQMSGKNVALGGQFTREEGGSFYLSLGGEWMAFPCGAEECPSSAPPPRARKPNASDVRGPSCFYVRTKGPLRPSPDPKWMLCCSLTPTTTRSAVVLLVQATSDPPLALFDLFSYLRVHSKTSVLWGPGFRRHPLNPSKRRRFSSFLFADTSEPSVGSLVCGKQKNSKTFGVFWGSMGVYEIQDPKARRFSSEHLDTKTDGTTQDMDGTSLGQAGQPLTGLWSASMDAQSIQFGSVLRTSVSFVCGAWEYDGPLASEASRA